MCGLTIIAILYTILNDYDYFIDKNSVIVKTPASQSLESLCLVLLVFKGQGVLAVVTPGSVMRSLQSSGHLGPIHAL